MNKKNILLLSNHRVIKQTLWMWQNEMPNYILNVLLYSINLRGLNPLNSPLNPPHWHTWCPEEGETPGTFCNNNHKLSKILHKTTSISVVRIKFCWNSSSHLRDFHFFSNLSFWHDVCMILADVICYVAACW